MANKSLPSGRPVAPGVDPITPVRDSGDHVTKTQNPETLNQTGPAGETGPADTSDVSGVPGLNDQSPVLTKQDDPKALPGNGATAEVKTIKVKTKDDIILMDPYSAKHIDRQGATVPVTTFINDELAEGGRLEKA